ncbi:Octaprenyl diphosphate synthase [Oceanimonas sp. MB9]|nr:Octaprenyl diphosphate synthase [Oceanimonas sp. MB9]
MQAVNELIMTRLQSDVSLINQLGFYIVSAGGKRMRPMLTVLAARALGYEGNDHIKLAALLEFIHTSTLLHDDVVDESELRRGRDTANALFGNAASVLVGDFLYTRSFQMMTELDSMRIMQLLSEATNIIAEGEVLQLMNCNDPDTTEASYMQVIYCKTAKLFEAATRLAAVLTHQPEAIEQAMLDYGKYLGTAFQLMDDVMDYSSDASDMGKNVGDDLAEGKPTLPLLRAMEKGSPTQRERVRDAIANRTGMDHLDEIMAILVETEALDYCRQRAREEAQKAIDALSVLPDSEHKAALVDLAHMAVERTS